MKTCYEEICERVELSFGKNVVFEVKVNTGDTDAFGRLRTSENFGCTLHEDKEN